MTLKFTILGCGSSGGVPRPALGWGACDPNNPKNRRRRSSLLVERSDAAGITRVLVDTSPDLREQLLDADVDRLDAVLYTHAGPEIGVAATKTFTAQVAAVELVGLALAQARGTKYSDEVAREYELLAEVPELMARTLGVVEPVRALAREIAQCRAVLFLGRHVGYPVALEGALKLKELAYMHAEGFPAGELKHGPIALIEDGLPVVVVMPSPEGRPVLHQKMLSNIAEITAHGARTVVVAEQGDTAARRHAAHLIEVPVVPTLLAPFVATIPLQVLAAEIAQARGYDVDKPRNLAKSVTVE